MLFKPAQLGLARLDPAELAASPYANLFLNDLERDMPACYIAAAEYDPLRDEGEAFAARLDAEGNEVACFRMNDGVHGYFLYPSVLSLVRDTYRLIAHFLDGDPLPKPGDRPWLTLLGTD